MAKKFAGFKREAMEKKILPALGYTGSMDQKSINNFLAANPNAAAKMGRYTLAARQRIEGVIGMAEGGMAVSLEDRLAAQKRGFLSAGQRQAFNYNNMNTIGNTMVAPPISGNQLSPGVPTTVPETLARPFGNLRDLLARDSLPTPVPRESLPFPMPLEGGPPQSPPAQQPQQPQQVAPHSHTIGMHRGGYAEGGDAGTAEGGLPTNPVLTDYDTAASGVVDKRNAYSAAQQAAAQNPEDEALKKAMEDAQIELTRSQAAESSARANLAEVTKGDAKTAEALLDPTGMVKTADVETVTDVEKTEGTIAAGTGDAGTADTATGTTATSATPVTGPADMTASTVDATTVSDDVQSTLDKISAATGKPSDEALADAATMKPDDLAALGLTVEQIAEARKVVAPAPRKVEAGEMIEGSTVDMGRVKKETNFEAATGAPSSDATVQGQLTGLMEQFEGSEPPAWAAGAMRAAAAQMAARGLSASSMAGQAAIQAAMESAMPIAVQDAQTSATFELESMSNRQQAAMFAAEKRAEFLNLEFTQEFQARVSNAAKISDIANMNFTADVQIALENAQMAQTVDITNLNAKNAKIMSDAAAMSQVDIANLNNRQQAAVQAANAFLNMDMKNLDNEQQTSVMKAQEMVNAMLSDQAAENAAKQFNATSENQTNQFFETLSSQIARFNAEQSNAMSRFNTGETNALAQFNTAQKNARDQFNAQSHLVIAQANAQWFQNITTTDNAAQNQANRDSVLAANNLTMTAYNNVVQRERDLLAWAWQSAENQADRDGSIAIEKIRADSADSDDTDSFSVASGKFLTRLAVNAADKFFK
jgi:hypothetical protein